MFLFDSIPLALQRWHPHEQFSFRFHSRNWNSIVSGSSGSSNSGSNMTSFAKWTWPPSQAVVSNDRFKNFMSLMTNYFIANTRCLCYKTLRRLIIRKTDRFFSKLVSFRLPVKIVLLLRVILASVILQTVLLLSVIILSFILLCAILPSDKCQVPGLGQTH